jgi:hypothetical protein
MQYRRKRVTQYRHEYAQAFVAARAACH